MLLAVVKYTPISITMYKKYLKNQKKAGFSLIELIVALSIYLIIVMMGTGALLSMVDTSKRTQSLRTALDNVSIAIEDMSRTIREGTLYHCDNTITIPSIEVARECPGGATSIVFEGVNGTTTTANDQIIYRLDNVNSKIVKSVNAGTDWLDVTGPKFTITDLQFYVIAGVNEQPRVFMALKGEVGDKATQRIGFTFQTTVTQRTPLYFD